MNLRQAISTFRGHHVPHFDFIGRKKWWFALSGAAIVASLVGLIAIGLNYSIAFKGGALLQYPDRSGVSVGQIQTTLSKYGRGGPNSTVEILGSNQINIRTASLSDLGLRADTLRGELAREAGISPNEINEQDVGPTWGGTISRKALLGLIVFLVLVSAYISLRFEPKMAGGALVALGHDLIITAGVYALVGREVTPETVIAILTILGYSLYDTVVIFDKIKENTESPALVARETYSGVVNISLNQTLMRSVNTSLVVLLPIGALLLFGGQTLKDFAFALFVGVASGTYSSIFVASPFLAWLKEREPRYQQIRSRVQVRTARPGLRSVSAGEARAVGSTRELQPAADGSVASLDGPPGNGASSRPRPASSTRSGSGSSAARKKRKKPQGKPKPRRR